jgi:hypothetical protein
VRCSPWWSWRPWSASPAAPATDGGELLGRAFFLAELPAERPLGPVRVTALDGTGAAIRSWTLGRCG